MNVVGVIDLLGGRAVHARGGERSLYLPVAGPNANTRAGDPVALARFYLDRLALSTLYVADLDAILGRAPQAAAVRAIAELDAAVWVDAGVRAIGDARAVIAVGAARAIVGLETLPSYAALPEICDAIGGQVVFSLDLRNGRPLTGGGVDTSETPGAIARRAAAAGVSAVSVLDLALVGTGSGPDVSVFRAVREAVPDIPLLAGGGVGCLDDIERLASAGCDGVLVATALLDGRLSAADVVRAQGG